ncbi:MAG: cobalamin-dependent protein [Candidatus Adiutrix sp.]|jgi:methanogenic corrinoid protein MtbC1|nr:cobalamin-dependent protein [Candidatus Adiutrix sp.]
MTRNLTADLEILREHIIDLQENKALRSVDELLKAGTDPRGIMNCLSQSLIEIGRLYQSGRYYMTGLVLAGEIMRLSLELLTPHLAQEKKKGHSGLIIVGTIEGDIHDLGKNLAGYFLEAEGFEVMDLGVDVSPRVFLREILQREPDAVGVSILLTSCLEPLKRLTRLLKETYHEGPAPPLFVGCGFMSRNLEESGFLKVQDRERQLLGVEYVVTDAYDTLRLCKKLTSAKRGAAEYKDQGPAGR